MENKVDKNVEETKVETKKSKGKKVGKIISTIVWVILFAWLALCFIDFFTVRSDKDPMFCLKKEVIKYDDGQVKYCQGLGYIVYQYERKSYDGLEFGPIFFTKNRSEQQ